MTSKFLGLLCSATLALIAGGANALCTSYVGTNMTFIVPNPGGGGYDTYARAFAPAFEAVSGATVQVKNVPAAGGIIGFQAVADADPDGKTIGIIPAAQRLIANSEPEPVAVLSEFHILGIVLRQYNHWVTSDASPDLTPDGKIVIGLQSISGALAEIGLVAHILGIETAYVPGYSGSSEMLGAVLRGEVDVVSVSSRSAKKTLKSNEELRIALNLTADTPDRIQGAPYFIGPGGLVDQFTQDLSDEERAERMALADMAVGLGDSTRSIATSANVPEDLRACLAELTEAALFSDEFRDRTKAAKRGISPLNAEDSATHLDRISELYFENRDLIDSLAQQMADRSR